MLCTLTDHKKLRWKNYINQVEHAYNFTKRDSTNYSPFSLHFGRRPRLPIDLLLPTEHSEKLFHTKYVQNWKTSMQEAQPYPMWRTRKTTFHWKEEVYVVVEQMGQIQFTPLYLRVVTENVVFFISIFYHVRIYHSICHQSLQNHTHLNLPCIWILQHLIPATPVILTTTNPTKPFHNVPLEHDVHLFNCTTE